MTDNAVASSSAPGQPARRQGPVAAPGAPGAPVPGGGGGHGRSRRYRTLGYLALAALIVAVAAVVVVDRADDEPGWHTEGYRELDQLVADDDAVCGLDRSDLVCLDATNGEQLFLKDLGDTSPVGAEVMAMADDVVLVSRAVSGGEYDLVAYDEGGRRLWNARDRRYSTVAPAIAEGVVVLDGGPFEEIQGIDLASGTRLWADELELYVPPEQGPGTPSSQMTGSARSDGRLAFATARERGTDDLLIALDPRTGDELWRTDITDPGPEPDPATDPATEPGRVRIIEDVAAIDDATSAFVILDDLHRRHLLLVDTTSGEVRAEQDLGAAHGQVATLHGTVVVLVGNELWGFDTDGAPRWDRRVTTGLSTGGPLTPPTGQLLVGGGRLYMQTKELVTVDPRTGALAPVVTATSYGDDSQITVLGAVVTADHIVVHFQPSAHPPIVRAFPHPEPGSGSEGAGG